MGIETPLSWKMLDFRQVELPRAVWELKLQFLAIHAVRAPR